MATLYTQQGTNIQKTWLLMFFFFLGVIAIGWGISWYLNSPALLIVAVVIAIAMNVGSYWYSDTIVIKMTGAKPVSRESHRDLWNSLENLAITAGLPMPKLYIVEDPAPNAFATGRNPEHAAVAVTSGLLSMLDKTELEGVLAHELAHIGNRDRLVMTVAVVLAGFVAIIADFFLRAMFWGGNNRDGRLGLILLVAGIAGAILAPIAAQLIQMAVSRKREFLADASAALLTRYPEGLASALEKIATYKAPMRRASHATAHLFIANPFGAEGKKSFSQKIGGLFMTHPPVEARVRALREGA